MAYRVIDGECCWVRLESNGSVYVHSKDVPWVPHSYLPGLLWKPTALELKAYALSEREETLINEFSFHNRGLDIIIERFIRGEDARLRLFENFAVEEWAIAKRTPINIHGKTVYPGQYVEVTVETMHSLFPKSEKIGRFLGVSCRDPANNFDVKTHHIYIQEHECRKVYTALLQGAKWRRLVTPIVGASVRLRKPSERKRGLLYD